MGIVLTGAGQQLTNARPVSSNVPEFADLANLKILGPVPILVVVMLAVLAVTYWMLRSTSFGRNVYAVGGDAEVAKYSGINVRRTKAATYLICGLTAALGGVMLASQLNSASSIAGENTALYVVCAVVVGGTSVAGGVGGAIKSTIGLLLLGLLTNAFNLLRIDSLVSYLSTRSSWASSSCRSCGSTATGGSEGARPSSCRPGRHESQRVTPGTRPARLRLRCDSVASARSLLSTFRRPEGVMQRARLPLR